MSIGYRKSNYNVRERSDSSDSSPCPSLQMRRGLNNYGEDMEVLSELEESDFLTVSSMRTTQYAEEIVDESDGIESDDT